MPHNLSDKLSWHVGTKGNAERESYSYSSKHRLHATKYASICYRCSLSSIPTFYLFDSENFNQNCCECVNTQAALILFLVGWSYLHRFFIQQISITDSTKATVTHVPHPRAGSVRGTPLQVHSCFSRILSSLRNDGISWSWLQTFSLSRLLDLAASGRKVTHTVAIKHTCMYKGWVWRCYAADASRSYRFFSVTQPHANLLKAYIHSIDKR